jgi:sulfate permease, SulP family
MQYFDDTIFGNPTIDPKAFISRRSQITGEVIIEEKVMIKAFATLDADEGSPFRICKGTNVQEHALMHALLNKQHEVEGQLYAIYIGPHCSIAHRALIHGPVVIGKKSFIGFDAIVHNSILGRNNFVDFKAVIKNSLIGSHCHIGVGAKIIGVKLPDKCWVGNNATVDEQEIADKLPAVPPQLAHADAEFNAEVVDFNKELVQLYYARRKNKEKA